MRERILVVGGSGAIGAATCRALDGAGYLAVATYRENKQRAVAGVSGDETRALFVDLTRTESIDMMIEALAGQSGNLAGVILAAGVPPALGPLPKMSVAEFDAHWRIGILGCHRLLSGLIRRFFLPRRRGIVAPLLAKDLGVQHPALPNAAAWLVAKYGLMGLVTAAAAEFPWLSVRSVSPPFTEATGFLSAFDKRYLARKRSMHDFATVEDVASDIVDVIGGRTDDPEHKAPFA